MIISRKTKKPFTHGTKPHANGYNFPVSPPNNTKFLEVQNTPKNSYYRAFGLFFFLAYQIMTTKIVLQGLTTPKKPDILRVGGVD